MKFDLFYQLPEADTQTTARRYRELIDEAVAADTFGFDTIWLAEVHFARHFSVMPAPMMLLAAIAERTTRLRLGQAVSLVPLHHPMRLAEELAMLDVLSGGRVEFGAGRGAFNMNYRGYAVDIDTSRKLFDEGLEFVKAAWTQKRVKFSGKHFSADGIELIPKPVQQPHPPIRLAANSPDTFVYAGERGYRIFAGGPVNPFPVLGDRLKIYDDALKKAGRERPDDWLAGLLLTFVGRDRASVRAVIEPSLRNYFHSVTEVIEPQSNLPAHREDFEKLRDRLRAMDYETAESIMAAYGEPEYIGDKIAELRERFGFDRLVCWFETGGIAGHQNVLDSMKLFAERVMPRFQ